MTTTLPLGTDWLRQFHFLNGLRERPVLGDNRESTVPGLHIVGDLADASIIKTALNQGFETVEGFAGALVPSDVPDRVDVAIVGAGPAGIGAALACEAAGLSYVILEKERPYHTIQSFPAGKMIFAEPHDVPTRGGLWFEDAPKDTLVERWRSAIEERRLVLHQPEAVTGIERRDGLLEVTTRFATEGGVGQFPRRQVAGVSTEPGATNVYRARKVVLAIGRRADPNRLGVPGEDLDKVCYVLRDPADHVGRKVLVVGGGDSAVEAAVAIAEAGGHVTLSYRKARFSRAKQRNQEALEALAEAGATAAGGSLTIVRRSTVARIEPEQVLLNGPDGELAIANDDVRIFIGTKLPKPFLRKLGVQLEGDVNWGRLAWIAGFAVLVYLYYLLKRKMAWFPFGEGDPLAFVPELLQVDFGWRAVDGGFWGTLIYTAFIVGFGVRALRKYWHNGEQVRRYLQLMGFQAVMLFGIPELLAPAVHAAANGPAWLAHHWKFYAVGVPWPLSIWSMVDAPSWWEGGNVWAAAIWIGVGAFTSFVLVPLYVLRNNEKFCSYLCGCGGLAETFGDPWRHLAPRGSSAKALEWGGRVVFLLAIPVTALLLIDAWGVVQAAWLADTKAFAASWYDTVVDFGLASLLGVAAYPYLGNRMWCRFFCPLRAYMEVLSSWFGRLAIHADDRCISCGECTRYCQMGIDVQTFAENQESFDNANSACIQCGICVEVCPMDVLELGPRFGHGYEVRLARPVWSPPSRTPFP